MEREDKYGKLPAEIAFCRVRHDLWTVSLMDFPHFTQRDLIGAALSQHEAISDYALFELTWFEGTTIKAIIVATKPYCHFTTCEIHAYLLALGIALPKPLFLLKAPLLRANGIGCVDEDALETLILDAIATGVQPLL